MKKLYGRTLWVLMLLIPLIIFKETPHVPGEIKMRPHRRFLRIFRLTLFCLIPGVFSGCALVGPSSISMGRADYNEAINKTEDEQMLLSLVKGRYGEIFSLLSVTGVAANVRFGSSAAVQAEFGPAQNYLGELVPFSAGLAYEENPTITYAPHYTEPVREYLDLLGLSMPPNESADIVIPVYFSVKGKHLDGVAITTRSTYDLIEILRESIDVPKAHLSAGLATDGRPPGLAGNDIRIHSSKEKPRGTAISVTYRGYWYFIHDTDTPTKRFYDMVRTLWSVSIASAADQRAAPVLTLPVSN